MTGDLSGLVNQANALASNEPETNIQPISNVLPDANSEQKRAEALKLLEAEEGKETSTSIKTEEVAIETPLQELDRLKKELEELKKANEAPKVDPLKVVEETATKAGIDLSELEASYVATGSLTKEQLESLTKAGFDQIAIDAYISMREDKIIDGENKLLNKIGLSGRDEYVEMAKWMAESLTPEECAIYDKGVESEALREYFIKTYYDKFKGSKAPMPETKQAPITIRGNGINVTQVSSNSFNSIEEVSVAMADPRYRNDHKYRNEVLSKLQRSNY